MTKKLTEGDPMRLIFFFTMPLIAGNIIQQLYGFIDTLLVGRFLGVDALAAVGCSGALMFTVINLTTGLTSGLSIYTGQRFGAKDSESVHRSAAACIAMALFFGIVMAVVSVCYCRDILIFMNTPPELLDDAVSFIAVFCAGVPIAMVFILCCNLIRALGNSKGPTVIMSTSLISNIIMEPIFILYFGWGIPGAAWGIVASHVLGLTISVVYIWKRIPDLHVRTQDWGWDWNFLYQHLRIALPMAFQSSLISFGVFIVQVALNGLGSEAVASFAAAVRVDSIAMMPMISFGIAMGAYTAQNFGAQDFDRIREGVRKCLMMTIAFSISVGIFNITIGKYLIEAFVGAEAVQVIEYGDIYLWIHGCSYFILSMLFVYRFTLQGVGQTVVPTFAGVMELIMRGVAAFWLVDIWGFTGVCMAAPLAWIGSCVPLAIAYYSTVYRKKNPYPVVAVNN